MYLSMRVHMYVYVHVKCMGPGWSAAAGECGRLRSGPLHLSAEAPSGSQFEPTALQGMCVAGSGGGGDARFSLKDHCDSAPGMTCAPPPHA